MKKYFFIMAIICSMVIIGTAGKVLAVQDRHTISEVRHACNMANGALFHKEYETASALLVRPTEMRQLNATLSTQEIITIVSLRGASRIKRFTGGQWYVKDFDKTFFITTMPDNLPSDEDVLKEVNSYFDKAIEHLEKGRDKE